MRSKKNRKNQIGKGSKKNNITNNNIIIDNQLKPTKSSFIPKYKIKKKRGNDILILRLNKGMTIINNYGCMSWMDNDIDIETSSRGGIISGLIRTMFTKTSMFLTRYTGTRNNNKICNTSFLPGQILPIILLPGKEIIISQNSLICFTDNLEIDGEFKLKGIMVSEGLRQTKFKNKSSENGLVWLNSYSGYQRKKIMKGESLLVDNGLFLTSYSDIDYTLEKLGSIKNSILSGEGFIMDFKGPCEILIQNKNYDSLVKYIASHVPTK
jgi:uncharacterized protein (TIGR00266 family)